MRATSTSCSCPTNGRRGSNRPSTALHRPRVLPGRRRSPARRSGRPARPIGRRVPLVLGAMGVDVGVPGAVESPAGCRRPRTGRGVCRLGACGCVGPGLQRRRVGRVARHKSPVGIRGRPPGPDRAGAQARPGWDPGRGVLSPASPTRTRAPRRRLTGTVHPRRPGGDGAAGFVSRDDAHALADSYRFLRTVEHRIQLVEEEQTHAVPRADAAQAATGQGARVPRRRRRVGLGALRRRAPPPSRQGAHHPRTPFLPPPAGSIRSRHTERGEGEPEVMAADAVDVRLAAFGFADAARTRAAVTSSRAG